MNKGFLESSKNYEFDEGGTNIVPKLVLGGGGILKKSKSTINKSEWWI